MVSSRSWRPRRKFSARAVSTKPKPLARAASAAAATSSLGLDQRHDGWLPGLPARLRAGGGMADSGMESRILTSAVGTAPWEFATVPDAWRVGAERNIVGGAVAALLTLPLAMGLGALA